MSEGCTACGDGDCRSRRGAARSDRRTVRVDRRADGEVHAGRSSRQLRRPRLTQQDSPGALQAAHNVRSLLWPYLVPRNPCCRHMAMDVDDILEAIGHAVQWAAPDTSGHFLCRHLSCLAGTLCIQLFPCVEMPLRRSARPKTPLHNLFGSDHATPIGRCQGGNGHGYRRHSPKFANLYEEESLLGSGHQ